LIGFFAYFKKFFYWKPTQVVGRHFTAVTLAALLFFLKNLWTVEVKSYDRPYSSIVPLVRDFSSFGCQGSKIVFSLPFSEKQYAPSEILPCGFNLNLVYLPHESDLSVKNSLGHPIHVRLEYFKENSFDFVRIQVVKKGETFLFPKENFLFDGLYLLKTPTNPKLGIQVILKGNLKNLPIGQYTITPNSVKVNQESGNK
jgi:hypothetical protein